MMKLIKVIVFFFLSVVTLQANANWVTPETLWKLGRISDPQISADGTKVLFNVRFYNLAANTGQSDIRLYDMVKHTTETIAGDSTSNETSPRWGADGKTVLYLNDKSGINQLYSMNADGSGKKQVSTLKDDINEFGISGNGSMIWFSQNVQVDKFNGKDIFPDLPKTTGRVYDDLMARHWNAWADGSYSHLFVVPFNGTFTGEPIDIMKGESYESPMKPTGGDEEIAWSPDGKTLAYTCKKSTGREYAMTTNSDIYFYDVASGKTSNLTTFNEGYDKAPLFSPDGKYMTWISWEEANNEASLQRLYLYDLTTKAIKNISVGFEYNVESLKWSGNSDRIYFLADTAATDQIFYCALKSKSKTNNIVRLTNDIADFNGISITSVNHNDKIVASRMSMSEPTEIFSVDGKTGKSVQLTYTNKEVLAPLTLAKVEKMMIRGTDGKDILTWVIYPPNFNSANKYPTLLYCQGGPQSTVSQFFSYRWNFQLMAANGYIVVAPNRRGLPGFGKEWNDEISKDWGGQAQRDLLSAIDSVSQYPYVNKEKLGAVGASYGGYSVFWLAGNHQRRFKAFISHCGVFNLESMLATEELFFYNYENDGPYFRSPKPKTYTQYSPHLYANRWDTPILIISNEKDYRIPYSQGLEAFSAARMQNIPARFLSFPDEGHWVLKPQNSIMWQREFYSWLDKYLK